TGTFWRPLRNLSYLIDKTLAGQTPLLFHAGNIVWHLAAVLGFFRLCLLLGLSPWAAAFAGALFAIHPAQSESVCWIKERDGLMSAAFLLWALVAGLKDCAKHASLSMLLLAASLLSKETGVLFLL